jgi:hypothetical protein
MGSHTAAPIPIAPFREARELELRFGGIEQAGPSFEGRVFLNDASADERSPLTPEAGYAGSFHVYGYGRPLPPAVAEAKERQAPGGPAVVPIEARLVADPAAVRAALERADDQLTVTVVPVPVDPGGPVPERPFETVEAIFDRAANEGRGEK